MMRKNLILILLIFTLTSCGVSKPSWERDECCKEARVTQNDHAFMGVLFSALVLFSLHTFTSK